MSDETKESQDAPVAPAPADSSSSHEVPKELRYIGLALSLLLITVGLIVMGYDSNLYSVGTLAVCVGFGITLAIFGAGARGTFLTFTIIGSGALAIALYLLLRNYPIKVTPDYFAADIYETADFISVRGSGAQPFVTGRTYKTSNYRFVASEEEIGDGLVEFSFDLPEGFRLPDGNELREFYIRCISAVDLKDTVNRKQRLSLLPDVASGFRLVEASSGRSLGRMNGQDCTSPPSSDGGVVGEVGFLSWIASPALAQDDEPIDIENALKMLESEDGYERDLARDQLARLRGFGAYDAVLRSWNISQSSYRADLGRLVAWSLAIQQDRANAVTLAEALSNEQLAYILRMTGQGDITMRQYATGIWQRLLETTSWSKGPSGRRAQEIVEATLSVLYRQGASMLSKPSMKFIRENSLYNTLVAIGFAECNIGRAHRGTILRALTDLDQKIGAPAMAKTDAKLKQVIKTLIQCQ